MMNLEKFGTKKFSSTNKNTMIKKSMVSFLIAGIFLSTSGLALAAVTPVTTAKPTNLPNYSNLNNPGYSSLQYEGTDNGKTIYRAGAVDAQAEAYTNGAGTPAGNTNAITSVVTCTASGLLSNLLSSAISSAISTVTDKLSSIIGMLVPIDLQGPARGTQKTQESAHTGLSIDTQWGSFLTGVSWDGVAYCIINEMISYIADSTIQWANNGFKGNPAFVANPEAFFKSIADAEAGKFIQGIAYNTTGINICQPFRAQVALNLSNSYGSNYGNRAQCTLTQATKNINNFMNGTPGSFTWGAWYAYTQNPANNPTGATILAQDELQRRLSVKNNVATLELGWNKGFLNFKKCSDPKDTNTCKTYTPGTLIQSSLEKSLGLPKDRLVLAQKFDQVVQAVVNNLIKVALNQVLSSGGK